MDTAVLLSYLEELRKELEQLTQIQSDKMDGVRDHDLDVVNACMKQEQVISLSLRGLEQKRDKVLQSLGLAGSPLSELPDRCPPEQRDSVASAVERVRKQYTLLCSAQEAARTMMEKDLRHISKELEKRGILSDLDEQYQSPNSHPHRGMGTDFRA